MNPTYHGACHCGAVRFSAALDLENGTSRCNCSICSKTRLWKAETDKDSFHLSEGQGAMTEYRFGSCTVQHMFCSTCGVKVFGRGVHDDEVFVVVSVATLDGVSDEKLAAANITYQNGREAPGAGPPRVVSHL